MLVVDVPVILLLFIEPENVLVAPVKVLLAINLGKSVSIYKLLITFLLASVNKILLPVKELTNIFGVVIFPVPCKVKFLLLAILKLLLELIIPVSVVVSPMIISPDAVSPEILDTLKTFVLSIFVSLFISIIPVSELSPICIFEDTEDILFVFICFDELI